MTSQPDKFRKKPVEIKARLLSESNWRELLSWIGRDAAPYYFDNEPRGLLIRTLEGTMTANFGDYIICGVKGEFYPCKPDIFAATHEPATAGPSAGESTNYLSVSCVPHGVLACRECFPPPTVTPCSECADLRQQVEKLQVERAGFERAFNGLNAFDVPTELHNERMKVSRLEEQVERLERTLKNSRLINERLNDARNDLQQHVRKSEIVHDALKEQVKRLKAERDSADSQKAYLRERLAEREQAIAQAVAANTKSITAAVQAICEPDSWGAALAAGVEDYQEISEIIMLALCKAVADTREADAKIAIRYGQISLAAAIRAQGKATGEAGR